jgi:hypothetical protein
MNTSQSKTIEYWFSTLPSNIRNKAIVNIKTKWIGDTYDTLIKSTEPSLEDALLGSFRWSETPEGFDYWQNIAQGNFTPEGPLAGEKKSLHQRAKALLKRLWP